jgi:hypothetical protein
MDYPNYRKRFVAAARLQPLSYRKHFSLPQAPALWPADR